MGYKTSASLTAISLAAVVALGIAGISPSWLSAAIGAVGLVSLAILIRSAVVPVNTALNGMDLLAGQDFNNRLAHVGERHADRIVRLFNTMIDRLREERLSNLEQENFLTQLIAVSPMGVVLLDFDRRITMDNKAFRQITGISESEDVCGREIESLDSRLVRLMAEVPLGENRLINCGDSQRYRCYHLSIVEKGFIREFYLIECLTEEVLKAERRAYENVIRTISHEVNNSMTGVKSVFEMLIDTTPDSEIREVLESCDARCGNMCKFISNYADVVRLPDAQPDIVDMRSMLERLKPFFDGMAGDGISVSLDFCEESLVAMADESLIEQALVNVVKNAIESIGETGGSLDISAVREGRRIVVTVADDGCPIPAETASQLFNPFFTSKPGGQGIGLTLTGEILRRHNSRFSLVTGADGLTRFTFTLPAA